MPYPQAVTDAICLAVESGETIRDACSSNNATFQSFYRQVDSDPALAEQYARACSRGVEVEFQALQDVAETAPERGPAGTIDPGWVQYQRLRVDTRKWALSKKAPKKYGEKVDMAVSGQMNIVWPVAPPAIELPASP